MAQTRFRIKENEYRLLMQDRVIKQDIPLLVIGLGGTGSDAVQTIKKTFAERFIFCGDKDDERAPVPPRTAYLVIDHDACSKGILDSSEFVDITLPGLPKILSGANHEYLRESERTWVPRDLHLTPGTPSMRMSRVLSRLMLERNYPSVCNAIVSSLKDLVSVIAGSGYRQHEVQIVVITGICGGTGSGTFLDIGQILRHIMRSDPAFSHLAYNLSCFLAMPDLTLAYVRDQGVTSPIMASALQANGYAALKELDFWMGFDRHHTRYVMNYFFGEVPEYAKAYADWPDEVPIVWGKPYDQVILMSSVNAEGIRFTRPYEHMQRTIAEYLFNMLADEDAAMGAPACLQFNRVMKDTMSPLREGSKRLPVNDAYRAMGVSVLSLPRDRMLLAEGKLLLQSFIPERDSRGVLVLNDALLADGHTQERFAFVARKSFQQLYNDFAANVPFPRRFEDLSAKNTFMVQALRSLSIPPHQTFDFWRESDVANAAEEYAENYRQEVWANFRELCRNIMADPDIGPFGLRKYLKDEQVGLLAAFTGYAEKADGMLSSLNNSIPECASTCANSYSAFMNPPLLFGGRAMQNYLDALRGLFDTVRQRELARQYAHALQMTVRYIEAYIKDVLDPLCDLILALEEDFNGPAQEEDKFGIDLFSMAPLNDQIQSVFADANKQRAVTRSFLSKLCDISFDAEKSTDADTCGLAFTFGEDGLRKTLRLLREEMDECFWQINGLSLDGIVTHECADPDPAQERSRKAAYALEIARAGVRSAAPLFSLSRKGAAMVGSGEIVKGACVSIPCNSPDFTDDLLNDRSIRADFLVFRHKRSKVTDSVHFNVVWDGLPLYGYAHMDSLRQAYEKALASPNESLELHLVWDGVPSVDVDRNWFRLPAPVPFYLFSAETDSDGELRAYRRARRLVERALAFGMLSIDSTPEKPVERPTYTFRVFRRDGMLTDSESIQKYLNELLGDQASAPQEDKIAALTQLLNQAEKAVREVYQSPIVMSAMLGMDQGEQPVDPFDPAVISDPAKLRIAAENFHRLTVEYATHVLLQDPTLLCEIERQIEAIEAIAGPD